MTSADCVNTGEMCSNGVCECLAGEKLVPGRCVRGKKVNVFVFHQLSLLLLPKRSLQP